MKIGSKTKVTREITRQERNRRNNLKRITISALVAFILFIALTVIQSSILNQESKLSVYQVKNDMTSGTKVTDDNFSNYFTQIYVQESLIPEGYITDKDEIIGKFVTRDYKAKDIVTTDGLRDTESIYNNSLTSPVKLAFSVSSLTDSVSGIIREGDYINIYGMRGEAVGNNVLSMVNDTYTFKHIYIDKAYTSSGEEISTSDTLSQALLFTVVIEESDVELFNEMLANCSLKLVKLMYDTDQDYKAFISSGSSSENTVVDYSDNSNNWATSTDNGTSEESSEAIDDIQQALDEVESTRDEVTSRESDEETTDETAEDSAEE